MRIRELASYMGMGKNAVYRDAAAGYVFEFATHKLTTPGHYKAWLREQAAQMNALQCQTSRTDRERLTGELARLRGFALNGSEARS